MSLVAYLGIASGVALVLAGLGLGLAGPKRVGGWLFTAFVVVWGTETALFNSFSLVDQTATIVFIERLALALTLVETLLLVHFTVRFTRLFDTRHRWWSLGTAAFTLIVGGAFAFDPSLFSEMAGRTVASDVLILIPNFAALYVTVGLLANRHLSPRSEIEHREVRIVLFGLVLYASYTAGFYLSLYGLLWATVGGDPMYAVFFGLFTAATVFLLGLAWNRWRLDPTPEHWGSGERSLLLGSVLVPFGIGLVTGTAQIFDLPRIDLFGLLRLGTAMLVAYGLLKFEIFDIDRRVKEGLRRSTVVAVFVLVFFAASETVEALVSDAMGTWAGLGAAGMLTLGLRPIEEQANRLMDHAMPRVDDSEAYAEERKVEVYQAAVERAAGDEVLTEREREILAGLREDLGLTQDRARTIEDRVFTTQITR